MIIVTGGAGFIGSAIIAGLNARGINDIIVVDYLGSDERWKNLKNLSFSDYMEKDDFLQIVLQRKLSNIEAVFHLGACSSTTETNVSYLIENNFEYTKTLAQWAVESNVRFIYASSAATYGDGSQGFYDDEDQIENLRPLNAYGYSKQLFDLWAKKNGLLKKIVGLKYFNVFGPNEYHKADMRSFVLKAFEQIYTTGLVKLFKSYNPRFNDGEQMRDFLYVKDAVLMTLYFLDKQNQAGIFNIGSGKARTWNDLVTAVFDALGKKPNIEHIEMPAQLQNQYQYFTQAPVEKIRKAGYDYPVSSLEEAVTNYVQNYLQKDGYLSGV